MTLSPSSSTLSTEAALASSATPETAPASSFRFPTDSFARRRNDAVTFLPNEGDYGVAMLFLPRDERGVADARRIVEEGLRRMRHPAALLAFRPR